MFAIVTVAVVVITGAALLAYRRHAREQRRLEEHSITPARLRELLESPARPLLLDVRLPLDLLADSEIIPGAKRIAPKEILANPELVPRNEDAIVYCTCPSDETSRAILRKALDADFPRVKLLKGGLSAWKAAGYPVEQYQSSFHLDTA